MGGSDCGAQVAMRHLNRSKLSEVLEAQLSYGDPRRDLGGRDNAAAVQTKQQWP